MSSYNHRGMYETSYQSHFRGGAAALNSQPADQPPGRSNSVSYAEALQSRPRPRVDSLPLGGQRPQPQYLLTVEPNGKRYQPAQVHTTVRAFSEPPQQQQAPRLFSVGSTGEPERASTLPLIRHRQESLNRAEAVAGRYENGNSAYFQNSGGGGTAAVLEPAQSSHSDAPREIAAAPSEPQRSDDDPLITFESTDNKTHQPMDTTEAPSRSMSPPPSPESFKGIQREVAFITSDLHKKLQPGPAHLPQFIAPFYKTVQTDHPRPLTRQQDRVPNPTDKPWSWNNPSFVKLPFSKFNYGKSFSPKWKYIVSTLGNLKTLSEDWIKTDQRGDETLIAPADCFAQTVSSYCDKAKYDCNFRVIKDDDRISHNLMKLLPDIIEHALKLPGILEESIPILKQGRSQTLCLTRDLACSLLANAFLCTFPEQNDGRNLPYFNFYQLFNAPYDPVKTQVKREKLKCIMRYFILMSKGRRILPNSIITFERRCYTRKFNWGNSTDRLCRMVVNSNEKLEDALGMLQVDFANRQVGGGVLNEGAVQEEIRFCVSPELICARLFTETLTHDEVLVITGTAQFNSYTGYSSTFKQASFKQDAENAGGQLDSMGREFTQVVAMDAYHFQQYETDSQYKQDKIDRELHKCNVAFTRGRHSTPVATGNWGCGAFNGDPELKFLIQWMAASVHRRDAVLFHANDERQRRELDDMSNFLFSNQVNVGRLYSILMAYESKCVFGWYSRGRTTVFQFVRSCVSSKNKRNSNSWNSQY